MPDRDAADLRPETYQPARTPSVQTAVGMALDWHSAGWGSYVDDVPQSFASCEVDSIAGAGEFDRPGHSALWEAIRHAALGMLSGAVLMPGCDGLEFRYVVTPIAGAPSRVQLFVTAKSREWDPAVAGGVVEAACAALPRGFTWSTPSMDLALARPWQGESLPVFELRRHEEVTIPQWDYIPSEFYYAINDDPGDGSGWQQFFHVLAQASRPIVISLLFKRTEIDWDERNVLAGITSDLAIAAEAHTDYDVVGNQIHYPADTNARVALDSWNRRISQLQRPVLARVAIRAPLDIGPPIAAALATAIAATTQAGNSSRPMYVELPQNPVDERKAAHCFDWLEIWPWGGHPIWNEETAPNVLRRTPYLFGINEAAGLALLPVPDDQGAPGFARASRIAPRRTARVESGPIGPTVTLGSLVHHGSSAEPLEVPLTAINRHTLVVGSSGSGKTTSVLTLLASLWNDHRIPFLAIEPIKTEYRALLDVQGMSELHVITLGRDDVSPFRLNPLAPPAGVRCEVHMSAVMAALKTALPLPPPLPQLLEDALDRAYQLAGWDYETTTEDGVAPPTLRGLLESFETVFEGQGYVGEARNIAAAVDVRLKSLLRGSRGRVLDTVESVDFDDLMARPVVIELDEIADNSDKAILAAFLLDRIRAAARARGSSGGQLKHVTVLEEAHRLLARSRGVPTEGGGDSAQAAAVTAFCEAIAELRSLGEGFVLSSQSPSELAPAAITNTGTRVLHRLESADDRKVVLDDLDASQLDREAAARLKSGEVLIRWPGRDEPEIARIQPFSGVDTGRAVSDAHVKSSMGEASGLVRSLLPYPLCTRDVCRAGCDPSVRTTGRRIATDVGPEVRTIWQDSSGHISALPPIAQRLSHEADGDAQLAYCAAVHLAIANDAFNVRRRIDIRPQIATAIREAADTDA